VSPVVSLLKCLLQLKRCISKKLLLTLPPTSNFLNISINGVSKIKEDVIIYNIFGKEITRYPFASKKRDERFKFSIRNLYS
jgi:hypothetical protein